MEAHDSQLLAAKSTSLCIELASSTFLSATQPQSPQAEPPHTRQLDPPHALSTGQPTVGQTESL